MINNRSSTKPFFLQQFERKEKEASVQEEDINRQKNAENRRPDTDLQVVSSHLTSQSSLEHSQEPAAEPCSTLIRSD